MCFFRVHFRSIPLSFSLTFVSINANFQHKKSFMIWIFLRLPRCPEINGEKTIIIIYWERILATGPSYCDGRYLQHTKQPSNILFHNCFLMISLMAAFLHNLPLRTILGLFCTSSWMYSVHFWRPTWPCNGRKTDLKWIWDGQKRT